MGFLSRRLTRTTDDQAHGWDVPPAATTSTGRSGVRERGPDLKSIAVADYLAEQSGLAKPAWLDSPTGECEGELWYVGRGSSVAAARLVELDPAPWFVRRGIGLATGSLPAVP